MPDALQSHMACSNCVVLVCGSVLLFVFVFCFSIFSAQTVLNNIVKSEVTMKYGGSWCGTILSIMF